MEQIVPFWVACVAVAASLVVTAVVLVMTKEGGGRDG